MTREEYDAGLQRIDNVLAGNPHVAPETPEGEEFARLVDACVAYEKDNFPADERPLHARAMLGDTP